jgi:hypothetical protein
MQKTKKIINTINKPGQPKRDNKIINIPIIAIGAVITLKATDNLDYNAPKSLEIRFIILPIYCDFTVN